MGTDEPRDFMLMTAQELAEYSGKVYQARCQVRGRGGKLHPIDIEAPTAELREAGVANTQRVGRLESREDTTYWRQQTGPKWAQAFGGISGRCATNPEDVPDEMMTAETFWRDHSNSNSG